MRGGVSEGFVCYAVYVVSHLLRDRPLISLTIEGAAYVWESSGVVRDERLKEPTQTSARDRWDRYVANNRPRLGVRRPHEAFDEFGFF